MITGGGILLRLNRLSVSLLNLFRLRGVLSVPSKHRTVQEWIKDNSEVKCDIKYVYESEEIREKPPIVINHTVSRRFSKFYSRRSKQAFVASIPNARVWGEDCNIIISSDNIVLSDVSRQFGAEGGREVDDFSIFKDYLTLPEPGMLKGRIAVVSTCGSSNFHHWNYDILPRIFLLKKSGLFDEIDFFLINHKALPFQLEGLKEMGVRESQIINPTGNRKFYIQAETLYIPSLTEELGTISPWVINFLRSTFLSALKTLPPLTKKIFLSRRKATVRSIKNEAEIMAILAEHNYEEFFPEDYDIKYTAAYLACASSIVSVHGSGLSNLAFVNAGAKVLDILAPYHQDSYYWMICNQRSAKYVALFSEGDHPPDDFDLVKVKIDQDLTIDEMKFRTALKLIS